MDVPLDMLPTSTDTAQLQLSRSTSTVHTPRTQQASAPPAGGEQPTSGWLGMGFAWAWLLGASRSSTCQSHALAPEGDDCTEGAAVGNASDVASSDTASSRSSVGGGDEGGHDAAVHLTHVGAGLRSPSKGHHSGHHHSPPSRLGQGPRLAPGPAGAKAGAAAAAVPAAEAVRQLQLCIMVVGSLLMLLVLVQLQGGRLGEGLSAGAVESWQRTLAAVARSVQLRQQKP